MSRSSRIGTRVTDTCNHLITGDRSLGACVWSENPTLGGFGYPMAISLGIDKTRLCAAGDYTVCPDKLPCSENLWILSKAYICRPLSP